MTTSAKDTSAVYIKELFKKQREYVSTTSQSTVKERRVKLDRIYKYLTDESNVDRLKAALYEDLRKPEVEVMTSELGVLLNSIKDIRSHLKSWMKDERVVTPLALSGSTSYIHYEAKGVALIISPWNYPFQLCINPLLYAIAAGCTAILKPSEYSTATSQYIADMISSLFDQKEVAVCQGGIPTSEALLSLPFDHMYFTGSSTVGKIVMKAASEHLSSVTLELGGKSPCFITPDTSIKKAAKKLAWGKYFNAGQTCIAPDYVLVPKDKQQNLLDALQKCLGEMYGSSPASIKASPDLGRLINEKHFDKVVTLLTDACKQGAHVVTGGQHDKQQLYIAPTILTDVPLNSDLMHEEIFGPVLPIISYETLEDAIRMVTDRPKPLALYIMSGSKKLTHHIINSTSAGGTVVNDFLMHFANHNLPFGGVNNSGIGKSHGKHGFVAFSNERAVMKNKWAPTHLLHPPYTSLSRKFANLIGKWI